MRYVAVATPAFAAARCSAGLSAGNFRQLPFVAFNRKDDMQSEFVAQALGLKQVSLSQAFVPSSEGQVRAVLAGWGVSVVPESLVLGLLQGGQLVNIAAGHSLDITLYWHCWNLESQVLDGLSAALVAGAKASLIAMD
jgi:LysR family transcriptional regulator (chromosome initiation inhibitor)